jgi:glycosyltransferase involved in cell wall biosynthesis
MRIAIVGIRGIPASYSGFETAAEAISTRLVKRGHEVTVYNRSQDIAYRGPFYHGVKLERLPTWHSKHLATIVHSLLATLHVLTTRAQVVHYFGAGPGALSIIARLFGKRTVCSVDGLDWDRRKWGRFASAYLRVSEAVVTKTAGAVITDSPVGEEYYLEEYGLATDMIAYGAPTGRLEDPRWLERFGLEPRRYILFVGRLVPEKNAHLLIEAFEALDTDMKLVIVGDDPFGHDYVDSLKRSAGPRVVFTGYLYGEGCAALQSNAYVFVLPAEVGGTPPVLLEAMGYGNCVLVSDMPSHLETIGDAGVPYELDQGADDLREKLLWLIEKPETVEEFRRRAGRRAAERYQWDAVVDAHEALYSRLIESRETRPGFAGRIARLPFIGARRSQ